jgi:hypothetical protein
MQVVSAINFFLSPGLVAVFATLTLLVYKVNELAEVIVKDKLNIRLRYRK